MEDRRRLHEAELRRVEDEKERALGLQRKERELREKLLSNLRSKKIEVTNLKKIEPPNAPQFTPLKTLVDTPHCVTSTSAQSNLARSIQLCQNSVTANESMTLQPEYLNGSLLDDVHIKEHKVDIKIKDMISAENSPCVLSCNPANQQCTSARDHEQNIYKKDLLPEHGKYNRELSKGKSHTCRDAQNHNSKDKTEKSRHRRDLSSEDEKYRKEKRFHKKYSTKSSSPRQRSLSRERARRRRSFSSDREQDKRGCSHDHKDPGKKQKHQKRSLSIQRSTWSR